MDLAQLSRYLPAMEGRLRSSYVDARRSAPATVRPYLDVNREFTLRGGKRFRAILVLAGYYVATGRDPLPVLDAAAAVEHFQSWMLIHDDIIDHSDERRGGASVHCTLAGAHRREGLGGSPDDYGVGIGITLGDLEEPFSVDAILSVRASAEARLAALSEFVRMTRLTAYGQLLDIRNGTLDPGAVTESDVLDVHRLKSAVYTVAAPLRIGALLGGAGAPTLADLERIATDLGIAFQLRDDVLGAGFDASESGKSTNDLIEGKRTLLVVRAWQTGNDPDRESLRRVLGRPEASPSELAVARETIRTTGSLEYSERRIAQLSARALGRLRRSRSIRAEAKPLLGELAGRLTKRRA
ncbi:MAG: polyprenyl synthetase family protein [Thermoplasmata archaeon]